jgi:UDP-N-acetylmuramate--alanine ligase
MFFLDLDLPGKIYLAGIGGSSMSSLAKILLNRGREVCGSDMQSSEATDDLIRRGVKVYIGQKAENIAAEMPAAIVKSEAVSQTNPEIVEADKRGIPVFRRAELLGALLDGYKKTIGVAGTHGKTTTSSMITSVFLASGTDFSSILGGHMKQLGDGYTIGKTDSVCVFESCEYKESYLYFKSDISVILNIAPDHMEYFGTFDNLINSFRKYLKNTKPGGYVVYNAEDEASIEMIKGYAGNTASFGLENGRFHAKNVSLEKGCGVFDLYDGEKLLGNVRLAIPGKHNIKNAVAAAAACTLYGLDVDTVVRGLSEYSGDERRFEYHCVVNGAVIADDYGHHPDAYKVTFDTARAVGFRRIIAIHQPHTFSRTKILMKEFAQVLSTVDHVIVAPIYAARETNDLYNVSALDLVKLLPNAEYCETFEDIANRVFELAQEGDIFITLGCGDIYKAAKLITRLNAERNENEKD